LSFFDEADEPRRPPRSAPRRTRPSGRGRPPGDQQSIQTRRAIAVVVVLVVVVLMGLLIHSCQVSQRNSSLKTYNNNVASLIGRSNTTGSHLFAELSSGASATTLQTELDSTLKAAQLELSGAQALSVPGQMDTAQRNVALTLTMRRDGVAVIAHQIQPALGTTANRDAINQIAAATARFYASDVVYKAYAAPEIAAGLNAASIGVGGNNGEAINGGQFLPALGWLQPSFIAAQLGAHLPGAASESPPTLVGVAVGTNTMVPGVTNHVQASPPPSFTITVTNPTHSTEHDIGCSVSLSGQSDTGSSTITSLAGGQTTTCSVTLPTAPTTGTFDVTATVSAGARGKTNTLLFPVDFL
jgi:hypothetical protein